MKIKTITCHDVYNFGASLQAFALMKYLENIGHEVEIIDYKPHNLSTRFNLWMIGPRWRNKGLIIQLIYFILKTPLRLIKWRGKRKFDHFKKKHMRITYHVYKHNNDLKQNVPIADAYIAGSDQIWNTVNANGQDPAFYLDFVPSGKQKISYAASFGVDEILPEYKFFVQSMLKKFDFISVREGEGLKILKSIGIKNGIQVLDPVFLLEKEEWSKIINKQIKGNYIVVCDFENNPVIEQRVKEIARLNGLKIYSVNNYKKTPYADVDYHDSGPETFLSLIKNAEYIVTNSFHATAFSLIFEKEFFVFNRMKYNTNSRLRDLLCTCHLNDRLMPPDVEYKKNPSRINYDKVNQELKKWILISKSYLNRALA